MALGAQTRLGGGSSTCSSAASPVAGLYERAQAYPCCGSSGSWPSAPCAAPGAWSPLVPSEKVCEGLSYDGSFTEAVSVTAGTGIPGSVAKAGSHTSESPQLSTTRWTASAACRRAARSAGLRVGWITTSEVFRARFTNGAVAARTPRPLRLLHSMQATLGACRPRPTRHLVAPAAALPGQRAAAAYTTLHAATFARSPPRPS